MTLLAVSSLIGGDLWGFLYFLGGRGASVLSSKVAENTPIAGKIGENKASLSGKQKVKKEESRKQPQPSRVYDLATPCLIKGMNKINELQCF